MDQFKIFRPFSTRFVKSNAHINVIGGGGGERARGRDLMRKLVYLTNLKQIGGHFAYIMRDTVESQVHEGYIWLNFVAKHVVNTEVLIFLIVLNIHEWLFTGGAGKSIIGGGGRYSYIHVLHHLFPLKVIVFTVCEHDAPGAPGFLLINIHHKKNFWSCNFFPFFQ